MNEDVLDLPHASGANALARAETASDQKPKVLQHFEHAVIVAVSQLGADAYPAEITRALSNKLQKHVSLAQVFTALERLEDKGFVSSQETRPEPVRGGRRRRVFQMEASGAQALRDTAIAYSRMSLSGKQMETINGEASKASSAPA
jgi:DNA-binding PadR family transcriptional regulator